MKRKNLGWCLSVLALVMLGTTTTAVAQAKPDLIISRFGLSKDSAGLVTKITVKVTNICTADAGPSYVAITFKESAQADAKILHLAGIEVPALKAGASSTHTLSFIGDKLNAGLHMFVRADPYKKVAEASEDNNWWTVNPSGHPQTKMSGSWQCSPKM